MTTLTTRVHGPRSADEVWERYAVPSLWSTWAPQIRRVEMDADRLRAGTQGRVVGPLVARVDFTVDSVDESARTWSWTVRPAPLGWPELHLAHGVTARGSGSETWLEVTGPLPVVLAYLPIARLALYRLVQ